MKYLNPNPVHPDEAGYVIEEGVVVDDTERPTRRRAYDEFTRFWPKTSADFRAEEETWAARSGPCVIIKQGRKTA